MRENTRNTTVVWYMQHTHGKREVKYRMGSALRSSAPVSPSGVGTATASSYPPLPPIATDREKRTLVFSRSAPSSAPVRNAVDDDDDAGGGGEIAFTVTAKGKGAAELRERERERSERAERYSPPLPRVDPENFSSAQDRLEAEEGRGGKGEKRAAAAPRYKGGRENEYVRTGPPSFSLPSPLSSHERLPSLEEEEELETAALDGTEGGRRGVSPPSFHSPPQKNGGLFFFLLILSFWREPWGAHYLVPPMQRKKWREGKGRLRPPSGPE